jgi:hypothetical protein
VNHTVSTKNRTASTKNHTASTKKRTVSTKNYTVSTNTIQRLEKIILILADYYSSRSMDVGNCSYLRIIGKIVL